MYVKRGSYNFTALREAECQIAHAQLRQLRELAKIDRCRVWEDDGCRDMVHWLTARYGIGALKARRWLDASYAITELPLTSQALASGELGLDKVIELVRFAKPDTEAELIRWAKRVTFGSVRGRADVECAPPADEVKEVERGRKVEWWYSDGGHRFGLMADLPAADGARVAAALDRLAAKIPELPADAGVGERWNDNGSATLDARRADALVMMCAGSAGTGKGATGTVHVNVDLDRILQRDGNAAIESGGILHPDALDMLLCDCDIQTVLRDGSQGTVGIGHAHHDPPQWLRREVVLRDECCTFPGCGAKRFLSVHHIIPWPVGPTDLDNLTLVCHFHHKLIHYFRWKVALVGGVARWFRPDGRAFEGGPAPPQPERAISASY
ncbi:MAG: hypothetical protein QOH90_311 [Actinomycetota bacterium]|nr:hypothetical protein [Actinomycetota bacterium]